MKNNGFLPNCFLVTTFFRNFANGRKIFLTYLRPIDGKTIIEAIL